MLRFLVIFLFCCSFEILVFSQADSLNKIKYTTEFEFLEGLYLSFDQLKNNSPIPKSRIISSISPKSREFFDKLFEKSRLFIYDNYGVKSPIDKKKIWGYSSNGFLYVNLNDNFHRISYVGSICHFVADVTVYSSNYNDPYYGSYGYYTSRPMNTKTTELRQYIFDFKSGKIREYSVNNLELFLMNDPVIYDEYMALRYKKKKQLKFFYIRKYNEKNDLFFPNYD